MWQFYRQFSETGGRQSTFDNTLLSILKSKDWAGEVFDFPKIVAPEPGEVEPTDDTEVRQQ